MINWLFFRNKTHSCLPLQVLCHAIVNLLPGGESSQVQEKHQVRVYTMIKQGPLHRIYATSFANQNFNPSLALIVLSGTRPWDFFWDIFFSLAFARLHRKLGLNLFP